MQGSTTEQQPAAAFREDRLLRPEQAAWYLNVKTSWVYEAVRGGLVASEPPSFSELSLFGAGEAGQYGVRTGPPTDELTDTRAYEGTPSNRDF
jgi:hypothetical protein